jgi:competence protein ComFC
MFKILNKVLNIIFPLKCLGCKKQETYLCLECIKNIEPPRNNPNKNIHAIFSYKNRIIKKAIWNLKYKGHTNIAVPLATLMYDKILEEISELLIMDDFKNPILIPIPLSKRRFRARGFNQSEILAKEIYKIDNGRALEFAPKVLLKIKETESQMKIQNRAKRLKNLSGCFAVKNPNEVSGRNIILIDDIITTGATIKEAERILLKSGAKKIIAFTIAH